MTFFDLERIRKLIFPEVPDPKHLKNKIMDAEQSQVRPVPSDRIHLNMFIVLKAGR